MTTQETQLINAIKALPGHQVFPGSQGGSVIISVTRPNGISQRSVWLGRKLTIQTLQDIISKAGA